MNPNSLGQYSRLKLLQFVSSENVIGISHTSLATLLKKILNEAKPGPLEISLQVEIDLMSIWV